MRKALMVLAFAALSACATAGVSSSAEKSSNPSIDADTIQVMVLGSSHLAGSTRDIANAEAVNLFTEERQAQLAAMSEALAAFQPNVIALERITEAPDYIDPKFSEYTPAMLAETADERVQVAYRLAKEAGITRVYGIDEQPDEDEPDYFPFGKLMEHAQATGQAEDIQADIDYAQELVARERERQASMTMPEMFIDINTNELSGHDFYYNTFRFDRGEDQPGAELQAYWFMRNAKIFSKLMQLTEPGDRVVVVYGAGHKHWLEHFAENTPGFAKIDPVDYLQLAVE